MTPTSVTILIGDGPALTYPSAFTAALALLEHLEGRDLGQLKLHEIGRIQRRKLGVEVTPKTVATAHG